MARSACSGNRSGWLVAFPETGRPLARGMIDPHQLEMLLLQTG